MRLLVTGGCGFVGNNFIRYVLNHYQPEMITSVDALIHPGSIESSAAFSSEFGDRHEFFRADIADPDRMDEVLCNHTRCSNNYGPFQHPEKPIPSMILCALLDRSMPNYGDELNTRDWIHVEHHCAAVFDVLMRGRAGEIYNVSTDAEPKTMQVLRSALLRLGKGGNLVEPASDRPACNRRYTIDSSKLRNEIGWKPLYGFERGLLETIGWYRQNEWWRGAKEP